MTRRAEATRTAVAGMLLLAVLFLSSATELGATKIVYRIGGQDLPAPEFPEGWDVEFRSLPWSQIDEGVFGETSLVDLSQDYLAPVGLDSTQNLTPLLRDRGGWIKSPDGYNWKDESTLDLMFDEDVNTAYSGGGSHFVGFGTCYGSAADGDLDSFSNRCPGSARVFEGLGSSTSSKGIWIGLGGLFPIRRIEIYPTPRYENERFLEHFLIGTNDGDSRQRGFREASFWVGRDGSFVDFEVRHVALSNRTPHLVLDMEDVPIENIIFESTVGGWEIAEFEIYGVGFAPVATYSSNIINLDEPAVFGEMFWKGDRPEGTDVIMSTRSGDSPDPQFYWRNTFRGDERSRFDKTGKQLTRAEYAKLEGGTKAGITPNTQDWEFWVPPLDYTNGVAELAAKGPRQYFQFRAELLSDRPAESRSQLNYVEFEVSQPPLVNQAFAEIFPVEAPPREVTRFCYSILPEFEVGDQGFDSIEIFTADRAASVDTLILSHPVTQELVEIAVTDDILTFTDDGFVIQIPEEYRRTEETAGEPIEVIFRTTVYTFGTQFPGRVFDSTRPWEVRQRLTPGDADPLVESNRLTVGLSEIGGKSVGDLQLSSTVLTPNGDGTNDELRIGYELVNLAGSVPVTVGVFDLSGRQVAHFASDRASGSFFETWDGTDGGTNLLPPGLYIIRMEVATDKATDEVLASVALAY